MQQTTTNNNASAATTAQLPYSKGAQLRKSRANLKPSSKTHNVLSYDVNGLGWIRFAGPFTFQKAYRMARELQENTKSKTPHFTTEAI